VSAFTGLGAAIQALLLQAPQITGDRVFRSRVRALRQGQPDGIFIRQIRTRGQPAGVGPAQFVPVDWSTTLGIEIHKRCGVDEVPEDAVDPLLDAVFERLAGAGAQLGGSVEDLMPEPAIQWDVDEGETPLVCATLVVQIVHRTSAASLAALS
jgi:hypothetical protein